MPEDTTIGQGVVSPYDSRKSRLFFTSYGTPYPWNIPKKGPPIENLSSF